jgi:hypothetical protein
MQPFALAVIELKAVALKAVELKAVEMAASAQKAWTPGQGTLPEDEI